MPNGTVPTGSDGTTHRLAVPPEPPAPVLLRRPPTGRRTRQSQRQRGSAGTGAIDDHLFAGPHDVLPCGQLVTRTAISDVSSAGRSGTTACACAWTSPPTVTG